MKPAVAFLACCLTVAGSVVAEKLLGVESLAPGAVKMTMVESIDYVFLGRLPFEHAGSDIALDEVCRELREAVGESSEAIGRRIGGPVKHSGFARLVS